MSADVALVADALAAFAGAEKTFAVMCDAFPEADVFTSIYVPDQTVEDFRRRRIVELADRRVFRSVRDLKRWYPLAALQMGRMSFDRYRVVLSSAAHLGRYIRKGRARHLSYCYYPFRLLFEPQQYPQVAGLRRLLLRAALPALRAWDMRKARQVDRFVGISQVSRDAIRRYYGRDADVLHPPVLNLPDGFEPLAREDFYLVVSRLERWKSLDLVVEAFRSLEERLIVVGDGPDRAALEASATPNVEFVGAVSEAELISYYRRARALIHAANTEYGLTPIEANAYGTPAICLGLGGVLETMVPHGSDPDHATALLFDQPTPAALVDAVRRFRALRFDPTVCHANARRFGRREFGARLREYVERYG